MSSLLMNPNILYRFSLVSVECVDRSDIWQLSDTPHLECSQGVAEQTVSFLLAAHSATLKLYCRDTARQQSLFPLQCPSWQFCHQQGFHAVVLRQKWAYTTLRQSVNFEWPTWSRPASLSQRKWAIASADPIPSEIRVAHLKFCLYCHNYTQHTL